MSHTSWVGRDSNGLADQIHVEGVKRALTRNLVRKGGGDSSKGRQGAQATTPWLVALRHIRTKITRQTRYLTLSES